MDAASSSNCAQHVGRGRVLHADVEQQERAVPAVNFPAHEREHAVHKVVYRERLEDRVLQRCERRVLLVNQLVVAHGHAHDDEQGEREEREEGPIFGTETGD